MSRLCRFSLNDSVSPRTLLSDASQMGMSAGYLERKTPFGDGVGDPMPPDWLIPEEEWKERIQEREAKGWTNRDLCRLAGIKPLDQNGTNYCVTEDTEVLTEKGWVPYTEYNWSDLLGTMNPVTGMLEFQPCLRRHVYEHDGQMIYSTNRRIDFGVTPDHRMLVRKWDESRRTLSPTFQFQRAGDLGWYFGLPHATSGFLGTDLVEVEIEGDRRYDGDDFVAMLSLICSDGYAGGTENTRNWVSFACTASHRYEMVAALAYRLGFRETPCRKGIWIRYDAGALANWVRQHCYSSHELGALHKKVPQIVKEASSRQIKHFLTMYGDQSHKGHLEQYFSVSKRMIDDLQELLLRVGKRGSIWKAGVRPPSEVDGKTATPRHPIWHLHAASEDRLSIDRKKHIEVDRYRGLVFCATVPNGTLITRRNGSILISGNCWANGVIQCMQIIRSKSGDPHKPLSPASVAAPIKGFKNVGGWGDQALDFIRANGCNFQEDWPANAIDRKYFTEENREKAKANIVTEWLDIRPKSEPEQISLLLRGIPYAAARMKWSHLTCDIDATISKKGQIVPLTLNSWSESWGDKGYGLMEGSWAPVDEGVAPRVIFAVRTEA